MPLSCDSEDRMNPKVKISVCPNREPPPPQARWPKPPPRYTGEPCRGRGCNLEMTLEVNFIRIRPPTFESRHSSQWLAGSSDALCDGSCPCCVTHKCFTRARKGAGVSRAWPAVGFTSFNFSYDRTKKIIIRKPTTGPQDMTCGALMISHARAHTQHL